MTITNINEITNTKFPKFSPIKENQDINIPNIEDKNISRRNGMVYVLTGSGGSGKTSLLLNMFKNKKLYRNKFNNIYYFCPLSSFLSIDKHPFQNHNKVYHELSVSTLEMVYNELNSLKDTKKKKKTIEKIPAFMNDDDEDDEEDEKEEEIKYNCIIVDDFANDLKNGDIVNQFNKMIIKARHLRCSFIFTLQSYLYFPKILRKQITYATIFKPKNIEEWYSISKELFNYTKNDNLIIYNYIYDTQYNHLDIDTILNKVYRNFNSLSIV